MLEGTRATLRAAAEPAIAGRPPRAPTGRIEVKQNGDR
jgi:hypothetical protein